MREKTGVIQWRLVLKKVKNILSSLVSYSTSRELELSDTNSRHANTVAFTASSSWLTMNYISSKWIVNSVCKILCYTGFRWSDFTADSAVFFRWFSANTGSYSSLSSVNWLLHFGEYCAYWLSWRVGRGHDIAGSRSWRVDRAQRGIACVAVNSFPSANVRASERKKWGEGGRGWKEGKEILYFPTSSSLLPIFCSPRPARSLPFSNC